MNPSVEAVEELLAAFEEVLAESLLEPVALPEGGSTGLSSSTLRRAELAIEAVKFELVEGVG